MYFIKNGIRILISLNTRTGARWVLLFPLYLFILMFIGCGDEKRNAEYPQPTEKVSLHEDDMTHVQQRIAYFEEMHRAGPDIDWRAIERENLKAAAERRRAAGNKSVGPGSWRELGSNNQSGRIHSIALSTDRQTLYAGADRGGVWKSDPHGTEWTPISDDIYGGGHEIAVIPGEAGQPDILIRIWTDWFSMALVDRSTDQGQTWSVPDGLRFMTDAKRILVMDDADHTVFLQVRMDNKWWLMVSKDRGANFQAVRQFTANGDIWTPRTCAGPLYVMDRPSILMTEDGGQTFTPVGNDIPLFFSKGLLAATETQPLTFMIAFQSGINWELWRSEDGGFNWTKEQHNLWSYFDYWRTIEASTQDPDLFTFGGTFMFYSSDGGANFDYVSDEYSWVTNPEANLHPDIPGVYAVPDPDAAHGEVWYIGTDGGLYLSDDQLETVEHISMDGLAVSQYYGVLTSRRDPDLVLAGSQDQGYQRAEQVGSPPPGTGSWKDFEQLITGDYGHLVSSNGSHDLVYSVYPGFILVQINEESPEFAYPGGPGGGVMFPPGQNVCWMPCIVADPLDPEAFFYCGRKLFRYSRTGQYKWTHVQHSEQMFTVGFLSAMAFSPVDPNRVYAVNSRGRLFVSTDGAVTWTESVNTGPESSYYWGGAVLPSSTDVDGCWVAGSGYNDDPVYRTLDGGVTWESASEGLPSTLVYCLAEAPDQSGKIFCGSESGAWVYNPSRQRWQDLLGSEAPLTTYWCCETVPSKNMIRFGTYSRGIWDYYLNTPGCFPYKELLGGPHALTLKGENKPLIGKVLRIKVMGCKENAAGVLGLSAQSAEIPLFGGSLLVDPDHLILSPFTAGADGSACLKLRLPNDPVYVGQEIFFQAVADDPDQIVGKALSHGVKALIGE